MHNLQRSVRATPDASKLILICIFPLAAVLKIFQFRFLPEKYFFDSKTILNMMTTPNDEFRLFSGSFEATAFLFRNINIFGFDTTLEWSLAITAVGSVCLFCYFLRHQPVTLRDLIISVCFIGILNIYVFNISKDIIQFTIFYLIYMAAVSNMTAVKKYTVIFLLLLFESIFYRSYYILTAVFFVAIVIFFPMIFSAKNKKQAWTRFFAACVVLFAALHIFLMISRIILPSEYYELINIRDNLNLYRMGSENAKTLIINLIPSNQNITLYVINYFINGIRMMLPAELAFAGLYYYPFMIFQFICSFTLIRCILRFNSLGSEKRIALYVVIAYYLVAFLFEPDFGSFVRHEASVAPVLTFPLLEYSDKKQTNDMLKSCQKLGK